MLYKCYRHSNNNQKKLCDIYGGRLCEMWSSVAPPEVLCTNWLLLWLMLSLSGTICLEHVLVDLQFSPYWMLRVWDLVLKSNPGLYFSPLLSWSAWFFSSVIMMLFVHYCSQTSQAFTARFLTPRWWILFDDWLDFIKGIRVKGA